MSKADERLTELLNRLCEDYDKIQATFPGLRRGQIMAMLCALDYMQYFAFVPLFCRIEQKLPKGYKKTDGHKVVMRDGHGSHHKNKWTEYLVECGDDLYISGLIWKRSKNKSEWHPWMVVEDWKTMTAMDVVGGIEQNGKLMPGPIRDAIFRLYQENGLSLGMMAHELRDI